MGINYPIRCFSVTIREYFISKGIEMMLFWKKKKETKTIELDKTNIPQHIAVIMDGNGRWAKREIYLELLVIKRE